MTEEKKGLREEIDFLKDQLSEKGIITDNKSKDKEKKFKFQLFSSSWFKSKLGKRHIKRGYVIVFHIKNRSLKIYKKQIEQQTIMIDGVPRLATEDNILLWNGRKPTLIVRDYSIKPLSQSDLDFFDISEDAVKEGKKGNNITGYRILMDRMKNEAIKTKKGIPGWVMIIGGLILAGVVAYMFFGKGFGGQ